MSSEKSSLKPSPLSEYITKVKHRDHEPLLKLFKEKFPKNSGKVLEISSGNNTQINYFAADFKNLHFYPSDKNINILKSIKKLSTKDNHNIAEPVYLDLMIPETWFNAADHQAYVFSAIFCINIFESISISIAENLMNFASKLLKKEGFLLIYGTFKVTGTFGDESNQLFHNHLTSTDVAEWSLEDIADLETVAEKRGLELKEKIDMPVNNFALIFSKK